LVIKQATAVTVIDRLKISHNWGALS